MGRRMMHNPVLLSGGRLWGENVFALLLGLYNADQVITSAQAGSLTAFLSFIFFLCTLRFLKCGKNRSQFSFCSSGSCTALQKKKQRSEHCRSFSSSRRIINSLM